MKANRRLPFNLITASPPCGQRTYSKARGRIAPPTKNVCYALLPSEMADPTVKQISVIIVTEGESGYHATDWKWPKEHAEDARDRKNAALGITPEEADRMLSRSLFPKAQVPMKAAVLHPHLDPLSRRVRTVLYRLQLFRKEDIRTAIRKRILHPSNPQAFGFGRGSYLEVCAWLGLRLPLSHMQVHRIRAELAHQLRQQGHTLADIATVLRLGSKNKAAGFVAKGHRQSLQTSAPRT